MQPCLGIVHSLVVHLLCEQGEKITALGNSQCEKRWQGKMIPRKGCKEGAKGKATELPERPWVSHLTTLAPGFLISGVRELD